ncbi:hypothetical protein RB594_009270 [Gaeumannomyces avenae]
MRRAWLLVGIYHQTVDRSSSYSQSPHLLQVTPTEPAMRFSRANALLAGLQAAVFPSAALGQDDGSGDAYNTISLGGYGSFSGTVVNSTQTGRPLPAPVDAWLGIDYSTQPVGDGRFRPVTWPAPFDGVKPAVRFGKSCVQGPPGTIPAGEEDEACLSFNVFRTRGVPLGQKTPVLVWIHGGSFYLGSYRSFDAAAFAASSKVPITVVNFHYRLNSLGFLPSTLFEEEGLLNLGLRDQNFFLQFVQRHIASFGGDPDAVTIGGRSAGGHSVGIHYFHNYGEDAGRSLFRGAIHQSGSVTARAFPNSTYPLYVRQFNEYMQFLGCPQDQGNEAALSCLRAADIAKIRSISSKLYLEGNGPLTWPFQPTAGGPLLEKFGSQSGYDGTFHHVPTITTTTTNEGKFYVPGNLETNQQFLDYLHNISPALDAADLRLLEDLYPDPAARPDSPYANSPNSTQYERIAAAWSDYAYICPGQETAYRAGAAGVPVWKARFDTPDFTPAWQGIPHTADARYTWDEPTAQHVDVSHVYHAYLASFVAAGDPNAHRWPGAPEWPAYRPSGYGLGSEPADQLVVRPEGGTKVEKDDIRREECLYWRSPERAPRLNK